VGDKWSLLIIGTLQRGPKRFGELPGQRGGLDPACRPPRSRTKEFADIGR
jgi:hypothetical protein